MDEIDPDDLFCYIRLSKGIPRRPVMVSEGSETVWFRVAPGTFFVTTGGDAELVSQNLAGSRCPFQPLFTKVRCSAQVNEFKQHFNDDFFNFKDMVFLELPNPAVNNIEIGGQD